MHRTFTAFAGLVGAILLVGCSQSHERDLCDEGDPCDMEGLLRCSSDNEAIETCLLNGSGCLIWTETERCDSGHCDMSTGSPECGCDDECRLNESRCDGDVVMQCMEDEAGCLVWERFEDCGDAGESCAVVGDVARCTDECVDECDARNDTRCVGSTIERCELNAQGCLEWIFQADCGDSFCDSTGGEAVCVDECVHQCDRLDALQCLGDVVQICQMDEQGCRGWYDQQDCSELGLTCVTGSGVEAFCGCPHVCTPGERQCAGDVVQICVADAAGCTSWDDRFDCSELGLPCDESLDPVGCLSGTGEGCDDVYLLWEPVTIISGDSFDADFDNYMNFTQDTCFQSPNAPDAVFAISAAGGATLYMSERRGGNVGGVNVAFNVMTECDETAECVFSADQGEGEGFRFDVPSDDIYYIVVEAVAQEEGPYELVFGLIHPEACDDGVDNDLDGDVDCDDEDCYGDPPCTVERNCGDGEDNDADGEIDCLDSDCSSSSWCSPYEGPWELFIEGDFPDVESHSITFEPDAAGDYSWGLAAGVTGFAVEPGTGTVTSTIPFSDDDVLEHNLTELPGFEFYGNVYWSIFVGSNGYITFGEGSTAWTEYLINHFMLPGVSGLRSDLNPEYGGVVTIDEFATRVAVTFEGVARFGDDPATAPNDFQMVLNADGTIELHYVTVSVRDVLIGLSNGEGDGTYPDEVDFVPPIDEDCGDGLDNDFDGLIDCSDPECFGELPSCAFETLCEDGEDNDADGLTDCDDPDCAGPECEPYQGYWERFDTDDEPDIEGHSITFAPDDSDVNGYSWALSPVSSTGFPEPPGDGTISTVLELGDNESISYDLTDLSGFPFYGVTYTGLYISSNGYVTFDEGDGTYENDVADHFEHPSVAGFRRDLYGSDEDTLWVDEYDDRVVVTYEDTPGWAGPNSFQIVLHESGEIDLHYVAVPVVRRVTGLIGISSGVGNGTYPDETNFVP